MPRIPARPPSSARSAPGARRGAASSALALLLAACSRAPDTSHVPDIVLITLDTTRADRLSCYGHARRTSPHLDALAAEGVRYENAYAVSSWTLPTHASLFTGKFPASHGSRYDPEGNLDLSQGIGESFQRYRARSLSTDDRTLAELLGERGYATAAFVGGPWMLKVFGLARGFEHYDDDDIVAAADDAATLVNGRRAESLTDAAIAWLDENADERFFLFLNYYDVHGPYQPPPPWQGRFVPAGVKNPDVELSREQKIDILYDAEILYMDHHLGRLFDHLRAQGRWEDTWVIVTADHGELLGENGRYGHGDSLTEAEIRIPLIIKAPGADRPRGVEEAPVQQPDLFSLIVDRVGVARPPHVQGNPPPAVGHPIFAEVNPLPSVSPNGDWRALVEGDWKLAWNSKGHSGLYRRREDPAETRNLITSFPDEARRLQAHLEGFMRALPPPGAMDAGGAIDEEYLRALRELGYAGG